jgi:hypothetical protein
MIKKLLIVVALLSGVAFAQGTCANFAAGSCPTGAFAPTTGVSNFYFIDYVSGSDSNSGASESSPWQHLPQMKTYTGSHTATAGDGFILKGCVAWPNASFPIVWTKSGTSSNHIYIGVDPGWYGSCSAAAWAASTTYRMQSVIKPTSGNAGGYTYSPQYSVADSCTSGSTQPLTWNQTVGGTTTDNTCVWYNTGLLTWNRPIFDAQSTVIGTECSGGNAANSYINMFGTSISYVDWSWIELKNMYWTSPNVDGSCQGTEIWFGINSGSSNVTMNYFYVHSYTSPSTAGDISYGFENNGCLSCVIHWTVADNSDGTLYTGIGDQWPTDDSVMKFMSNEMKPKWGGDFGRNDLTHNGSSPDTGGGTVHPNCFENIQTTSNTFYIHDNRIHDMTNSGEGCETLQIGNPSETDYVWNNLIYNTGTANCPDIPQNCSTGVNALYMFNNTFVCSRAAAVSFSGCAGTNWSSAFVMSNNHCIQSSATGGTSQSQYCLSGGTVSGATTISFQDNLSMTSSTASSDGYTSSQTNVYSPTSGSAPTVGAGANLTSTYWPSGYSTNDTTYAVLEETVNGIVQPVGPQRTTNTRPSTGAWDIGAYEHTSGSTYTITVSSITGNGTITSSDSVINCTTGTTGTCTDSTASGTVTLTETPASGYSFTSWGGGTCSGSSSTCAVTTTATVTATFTANPVTTPAPCAVCMMSDLWLDWLSGAQVQ